MFHISAAQFAFYELFIILLFWSSYNLTLVSAVKGILIVKYAHWVLAQFNKAHPSSPLHLIHHPSSIPLANGQVNQYYNENCIMKIGIFCEQWCLPWVSDEEAVHEMAEGRRTTDSLGWQPAVYWKVEFLMHDQMLCYANIMKAAFKKYPPVKGSHSHRMTELFLR